MKEIPLSKNGKYKGLYVALVDDEDYEILNQYNWSLEKLNNKVYAIRHQYIKNNSPIKIIMHRIIMGADATQMIDHKDGNGLNNQRHNLRFATNSQNQMNKRATGKSKYLGVCWHVTKTKYYRKKTNDCGFVYSNGKWSAAIKANGKYIHLGHFELEVDAAKAYNEAALKYHGEFARLNVIEE